MELCTLGVISSCKIYNVNINLFIKGKFMFVKTAG